MGLQLFGPLGNNRYLDYAHDISRSAQHLLELINDVLDISKIEAGKHELSITGIDLAVIATEAVRELQGQMREKSLHFNFDVDRNAASIRADGTAIRQMLTNLLSNAVKFTPENGDIMLSITTVKSGTVKITISDTGIGIPEEDIEKVLTPFGQSGDIELAREGGTGLGLPIVNALAKLHGGTFDIESVIGVGTQAHITLPRTPDPGSAEADSAGQGAR
jgi:signal transduction histidine kinase